MRSGAYRMEMPMSNIGITARKLIGEARAPGIAEKPEPVQQHNSNWPVPKPLPTGLLPVEPFDFALLPTSIAPWVADIAERMQCSPDFVGVPAVVALGSVIGRRVGIRPQRRTDWLEVPNLWGCIVGRPGAMKSPAMAEALKPLYRLEAQARKSNDEARKAYAVSLEAHKLKQEAARTRAKNAIKQGADALGALSLEEPEAPKDRRYVANDCTYEALGEILADNPNGVLAFRDELVSLLAFADYLESHARRCYAAGSEAETAAAKAIVSRIRKGDLADGFTCRDVHRQGWSNLSAPDQVQSGLNLLIDCDWLAGEAIAVGSAGGRPKTVYRINPRVNRR
jgi:hypothetical protein